MIAPSSTPTRRPYLLALAGGLSIAAFIAAVALLTSSFDRTDARLIGTSLGFSIFSALGAAGRPARRGGDSLASLGTIAAIAAGASFATLVVALWADTSSGTWRVFGCLALLSLATSHACLVLSARRITDSPLISNLTSASVLMASLDAVLAGLAVSGVVQRVHAGYVRAAAVLVIAMLLSTALPPILRRAREAVTGAAATANGLPALSAPVSAELMAVATRLEELVPHAGELGFSLEREAIRIRQLATTTDPHR